MTTINKKPKLAVVTHYQGKRPELMARMIESVVRQLPADAVHFRIHVPEYKDFERSRWESLQLADYVCWIDDDDLLINDSLNTVMEVINHNPDVGCVFTNQQLIDKDGNPMPDPEEMKDTFTYKEVALIPQVIHHLAVVKSAAVHPAAFAVSEAVGGVGIDWLMKASAALGHGAIHVPILGYQWRQYPESMSKGERWVGHFNERMAPIQAFLLSHVYPEGEIPQSLQ